MNELLNYWYRFIICDIVHGNINEFVKILIFSSLMGKCHNLVLKLSKFLQICAMKVQNWNSVKAIEWPVYVKIPK